mgnify:CR=1 FL=1
MRSVYLLDTFLFIWRSLFRRSPVLPRKHGIKICGGNVIILILMFMVMVVMSVVMFLICVERECV